MGTSSLNQRVSSWYNGLLEKFHFSTMANQKKSYFSTMACQKRFYLNHITLRSYKNSTFQKTQIQLETWQNTEYTVALVCNKI